MKKLNLKPQSFSEEAVSSKNQSLSLEAVFKGFSVFAEFLRRSKVLSVSEEAEFI